MRPNLGTDTSKRVQRGVASAMAAVLAATTVAAPVANSEEVEPQIHGPLVLAEVMYYDSMADEISLDERSIDYDRVTQPEVDQVKSGLATLTDEEIDEVLVDNGYNPSEMRRAEDSGVAF